jgi:hypothetical protein
MTDILAYFAYFSILCLLVLAWRLVRLNRRWSRRAQRSRDVIQWRPEWCQSELEAARERIKR